MMRIRSLFSIVLCLAATLAGCSNIYQSKFESSELPTSFDQSDPEKRARLRLDLAVAYFENGQNQVALDELKQAVAIYPKLSDIYNVRGLIYAAMGLNDLAIKNFSQAIRLNPRNVGFWHNQCWFYCQNNRPNESKKSFENALSFAKQAELFKLWLAYGICLGQFGDLQNAEVLLLKAHEQSPQNEMVIVNLGEIWYQFGKYNLAEDLISKNQTASNLQLLKFLQLAEKIYKKTGNFAGVNLIEKQLKKNFSQEPELFFLNQEKLSDTNPK